MLAEVQAANAALSAITGAIQNGKDIGDTVSYTHLTLQTIYSV